MRGLRPSRAYRCRCTLQRCYANRRSRYCPSSSRTEVAARQSRVSQTAPKFRSIPGCSTTTPGATNWRRTSSSKSLAKPAASSPKPPAGLSLSCFPKARRSSSPRPRYARTQASESRHLGLGRQRLPQLDLIAVRVIDPREPAIGLVHSLGVDLHSLLL